MYKQLVYLIIPPELHGINRVKLGRSNSNTDDRSKSRLKSYGKDTHVVHRISVPNSIFVEKRLIDKFKKKYKQIKREYFEGDIVEMTIEFLEIVTQCLSDRPTYEEEAYINKIHEEEQEIIMQEQKLDDLKNKSEK